MPRKRPLDSFSSPSSSSSSSQRPTKRQRTTKTTTTVATRNGPDLLTPLSDELLLRVLSYLSFPQLLALGPVSRRFHRLSQDSQLWKALYYARFVLPRALRIPGFRGGGGAGRLFASDRGSISSFKTEHKLHYTGRRRLWVDGRLGGVVRDAAAAAAEEGAGRWRSRTSREEEEERQERGHLRNNNGNRVNWKRQYRIRHNWARGKCAVEELKLAPDSEHQQQDEDDADSDDDNSNNGAAADKSRMLVKVVEGLAVTADRTYGLRAWDLKTRQVLAQAAPEPGDAACSCLAIDDHGLDPDDALDIAVGFTDGSFSVWRLDLRGRTLGQRYRHGRSSNGGLVGMAYSHPYLLTATGAVLVSLYTFDVPDIPRDDGDADADGQEDEKREITDEAKPGSACTSNNTARETSNNGASSSSSLLPDPLPAPYLLNSLKSHTSDPPLALSIRTIGATTVASIAYTFFTRHGWSIGIQDLHITTTTNNAPPAITTRLAYTAPFNTNRRAATTTNTAAAAAIPTPPPGPTTLCYSHPYLLAALPDNTLVLHLCTSTAAALSISPGIRLWGHTSGISDAEITARGKAVSVSSRGGEMRVWELEGRPSGVRSRSVEIKAGAGAGGGGGRSHDEEDDDTQMDADVGAEWEERRNWVGFDDEMVIVLKEAKGGRESLLVYDFT